MNPEELLSLISENLHLFSGDELREVQGFVNKITSRPSEKITPLRQEIPSGVESLWTLAGGNPNAFKAYLKTFPNAQLNDLSRNKNQLDNVIGTLADRVTFPSGQVEGGVPKSELNSSNVYGFQYDPRTKTLRVRFNRGGIYEYDNVPPFVYKMFARGAIPAKTNGQNEFGSWWVGKQPSLGASFWELIRDNFPYQKVA